MAQEYAAGARFGEYVLERRLGGGGFGDVWRALDAGGAPVALKLLKGEYTSSDAMRLRTDVELLAGAASGQSPHIVRVLGGGAEPAPHVIMEYVEGADLMVEISRQGSLPVPQVLSVARGVGEALAILEEASIIHRDVKPHNVMVDTAGVVKLTDFGIARIVGYDTITGASQTPMSMAYAAPEVWDGKAGPATDLYAYGVTLFQCLAGRPPFTGSFTEMFKHHMEDAPDLKLLPVTTPYSLRELIADCMAKRPEDRPHSADAALRLVSAAEREYAATGAAQPGATLRLPGAFGPWLRRSPHATRPWTFLCVHETRGDAATVEVHFADSIEYGNLLRRAVEVNPRFVALGAERLLGTSRLLLRPGEGWHEPPAGRFQFWVARDEQPAPTTLANASTETLRRAAAALQSIIDTAAAEHVSVSLRDEELSLLPDGRVSLLRPVLPPYAAGTPQDQAALWLNRLQDPGVSPAPAATTGAPCSRCGTRIGAGQRFCGACGYGVVSASPVAPPPAQPAPAGTTCPRCGVLIALGRRFCANCGFSLTGAAPAVAPLPQPAPVAPAGAPCPRCGSLVPPGMAFCATCGYSAAGPAAPPWPAPAQRESLLRPMQLMVVIGLFIELGSTFLPWLTYSSAGETRSVSAWKMSGLILGGSPRSADCVVVAAVAALGLCFALLPLLLRRPAPSLLWIGIVFGGGPLALGIADYFHIYNNIFSENLHVGAGVYLLVFAGLLVLVCGLLDRRKRATPVRY